MRPGGASRWAALIVAIAGGARAGGQCALDKLLPSDGAPGEQFGRRVALSPDAGTAVVGPYYHNEMGGPDAGSAYVYVRESSGWVQQIELVPADSAPYQ